MMGEGEGAGVPPEPAPVEELPCGSRSGAWAAVAPAAKLSPSSGEVALGQILLCLLHAARHGHLGKCTFPPACRFAFLTEQISAGY